MLLGRKLVWMLVAVAFAMATFSAADQRGFRRYFRLRDELRSISESNRATAISNRALVEEIKALRSDPQAIERAAREELGYVKPGELVFAME